jgi:hypothetical protein
MVIFITFLMILGGDFSIQFVNNQYYVFWRDLRLSPFHFAVFGSRVETNGNVLDPDGRLVYYNDVISRVNAANDGSIILVVFRDLC